MGEHVSNRHCSTRCGSNGVGGLERAAYNGKRSPRKGGIMRCLRKKKNIFRLAHAAHVLGRRTAGSCGDGGAGGMIPQPALTSFWGRDTKNQFCRSTRALDGVQKLTRTTPSVSNIYRSAAHTKRLGSRSEHEHGLKCLRGGCGPKVSKSVQLAVWKALRLVKACKAALQNYPTLTRLPRVLP